MHPGILKCSGATWMIPGKAHCPAPVLISDEINDGLYEREQEVSPPEQLRLRVANHHGQALALQHVDVVPAVPGSQRGAVLEAQLLPNELQCLEDQKLSVLRI